MTAQYSDRTWTDCLYGSLTRTWRNSSKRQVVQVPGSRKPINAAYKLQGLIMETFTRASYMGVDITSNLSWRSNIERITDTTHKVVENSSDRHVILSIVVLTDFSWLLLLATVIHKCFNNVTAITSKPNLINMKNNRRNT